MPDGPDPSGLPEDPVGWLARCEDAGLDGLGRFLAFPSVSTQAVHHADVARCAEWLAAELTRIGMTAGVWPSAGHPVVLGEWRGAGPEAPTILIYGHYDVQPPEPLEKWDSSPFTAAVREGRLYARGAADDKGQVWIHVQALEAWLATRGLLPANVIMLIEGEEEVGSPSLPAFLDAHRRRLACDYIVISDTMMHAPGVPSILASMRGLAYFELACRSARSDLHSGQYGGVVPNAAAALARLLASLTGRGGEIAIEGFYDDVRPPPAGRRREIARLPFEERSFAATAGVETLAGEAGFSPLERIWLRPTCEVNGILGGYTGEGAKTVIPSTAVAKLSFRLVPDQTPEQVERLLREHLARVPEPGVRVELRRLHGGLPWAADQDSQAVTAARRALFSAFEQEAVIGGTGGTIPIVPELAQRLGAEILLVGFGLPGENAHAPNEWIALDNVRLGTRAMVELYRHLGIAPRSGRGPERI